MAKPNWCTRKDEELVIDRLMHGGNVCQRCKLSCTLDYCSEIRLIVGRNSYKIINATTRHLPIGVHHCSKCNKQSGKIVAQVQNWNDKEYYAIMCKTCGRKWLKKF